MMLNKALLLGAEDLNGVIGDPVSYHGFTLQRHASNKATVMTYKAADGTIKKMAVLDAAFKSIELFGAYGVDVPELEKFTISSDAAVSRRYVTDSVYPFFDYNAPMPDSVTNAAIFDKWQRTLAGDQTARRNCDIWMRYKDETYLGINGVPAVEWCRSQKLIGRACDLPNLYEAMCIWACGDKLDDMDITKNAFPDLRLGYTSTAYKPGQYGHCQEKNGKYSSRLWTSTDCTIHTVRCVSQQGCAYSSGSFDKCEELGTAVPILELD